MDDHTFPAQLLALARQLHRVGYQQPDLTIDGAVTAIQARGQCLRLVQHMLRAAGVRDPHHALPQDNSRRRTLSNIIKTIGNQIGNSPTIALAAFAETDASIGHTLQAPAAQDHRPVPAYEQQWRTIWHTAMKAGIALETLHDTSVPRQVDWTIVADAAAIASTIARLDEQLLNAATPLLPAHAQDEISTSISRTHLAPAAALTTEQCHQHPLPPLDAATSWRTHNPQPSPPRPVRDPSDLPATMDRLLEMLQTDDLEPRTIPAIAATLTAGLQLSLQLLPRDDYPDQHLDALQLQNALQPLLINRHPHIERSPDEQPPSRRLLAQLDHLHRYFQRSMQDIAQHPERAAIYIQPTQRLLAKTPTLINESLATTIRHLNDARWLTTVGPGSDRTTTYRNWHRQHPRLLEHLVDAARSAWQIEQRHAGEPPALSQMSAVNACKVDASWLRRRAAKLEAYGATTGGDTWQIPITSLLAIGAVPDMRYAHSSMPARAAQHPGHPVAVHQLLDTSVRPKQPGRVADPPISPLTGVYDSARLARDLVQRLAAVEGSTRPSVGVPDPADPLTLLQPPGATASSGPSL